MEDTLIFVDEGFFGLVKKHFQKEDGKLNKHKRINKKLWEELKSFNTSKLRLGKHLQYKTSKKKTK